jgi:aryl-alcohol dehydrogenase-like predicted oxidoreductase
LGCWLGQGGGRRDAVVLATKVFNPVKRKANLAEPNTDGRSLSAYKIRKHCEGSLKRLQTDHIDLYQMHHVDRDCPWDETWQAFEQLGNQGKVVYVVMRWVAPAIAAEGSATISMESQPSVI